MRILLAFILTLPLAAQSTTIHCPTAVVGCAIPAAYSWTITKTAGDWVITGTGAASPQTAVAATTQAIDVATIAADWFILQAPTIKTTTACAGVTVITVTSVGVTGSASLLATGLTYDLKAAVAATNLSVPALATLTPNTTASTTLTVTVSGTAQNVSGITDGCAFKLSAVIGVRP